MYEHGLIIPFFRYKQTCDITVDAWGKTAKPIKTNLEASGACDWEYKAADKWDTVL